MFLLDDFIMATLNSVVWLGKRFEEAADAQLFDEKKLLADLVELQERSLLGEVDETTYQIEEERLLAYLEEARRRAATR